MKARLIPKSGNGKTGPIPVSYSDPGSCPDACPLNRNGCYAEGYPVRLHWHAAEKFVDWEAFCAQLAELPTGQLWRHNVAGDLPGRGDRLDVSALMLLVRANMGLRGFTYTHKPLTTHLERQSVSLANQLGFTINLSADDMVEADALSELRIGPVVVTLTSDAPQVSYTPAGRTVVACPAEQRDITCADCQLCSVASRKAIVGFRAHGQSKGRINRRLKVLQ